MMSNGRDNRVHYAASNRQQLSSDSSIGSPGRGQGVSASRVKEGGDH
jgi:hypothetical protein